MRNLATYQDDYETLPFEDIQTRYRKRRILDSLRAHGARNVLEVGCGLDAMFNHYAGFERFTVVEPAERFVAAAAAKATGRPDIRVVRGTVEEAHEELSRDAYDFVILSSLLHEIADADTLLSSVRSLCSTGTILHINVPNALSVHRLLAAAMGLIADVYERSATQARMQQHHTYDVQRLTALLSRNGLRIIDQGTFFVKPFTHAQMAALRAAGMMSDPMLDGLYALSAALPDNGSEIWVDATPADEP